MIEKPIRKYQKQKDYQKHKILRRIKKRDQRRKEAASKIAERALRKKLKLPAFDNGKDEDELLIGGYVAPELIVTPEGNAFRTTESGQPAVSTGALLEAGIPIRRKSKELKNNQKLQGHDEYLAQQAAADEIAKARTDGLNEMFADLLTAGFASQMAKGGEQLRNGDYVRGAINMASPLMLGSGVVGDAARALFGGWHLADDDGVRKTWNHLQNGEYGRAALSGAGDLLNAGMLAHGVNQLGRYVNTSVENFRYPLGRVNESAINELFPVESNYNFWHGGLDSDFNFKGLDVFRLGSKQAKRGRNYAGFYMYDSSNQPAAFRYGGGEAHGIRIPDNAKIFNADFNTERISADKLREYQKQGYDLIKGKNVFGYPEYILLNKDIIASTKFFENFPNHRIFMRPPRAKEVKNTLSWEEAAKSPQTTARNAQQQIGEIMPSSSLGNATNAAGDINNVKSDSFDDFFKQAKINAFLNGDPYFKADFGPYGIHRESFPSDWTITKMPFSDKSREIMTNTAKPRILAQAEKDIRSMYDPTIDGPDIEKYVKEELSNVEKQLDEKIKQGYDLGSEELFKFYDTGKTSTYTGGLQRGDNGQIVLRDGQDPERFAVHEWEHRRTNRNINGEYYGTEKRLLRKAFTKEFRELSETVSDFKGMKMDNEMVTTNSDARAVLLGEEHLRKTSPELQNKIIDASSDEKIFDAVKKSNAYGYYYMKQMEESGKLTHELAQNIREALKHVGGYAAPIGIGLTGYGLYNSITDPINLSYNKGKDPIHIKPSKRGTFTAAARKRGMGVQQFANKVLKNPSNYSLAMRKKAQFAKNATKFKH